MKKLIARLEGISKPEPAKKRLSEAVDPEMSKKVDAAIKLLSPLVKKLDDVRSNFDNKFMEMYGTVEWLKDMSSDLKRGDDPSYIVGMFKKDVREARPAFDALKKSMDEFEKVLAVIEGIAK